MSNIVPETLKEQVSVWANKATEKKCPKNTNIQTIADGYDLLPKPMSIIFFKLKKINYVMS